MLTIQWTDAQIRLFINERKNAEYYGYLKRKIKNFGWRSLGILIEYIQISVEAVQ
jgi:hypothetical protein